MAIGVVEEVVVVAGVAVMMGAGVAEMTEAGVVEMMEVEEGGDMEEVAEVDTEEEGGKEEVLQGKMISENHQQVRRNTYMY